MIEHQGIANPRNPKRRRVSEYDALRKKLASHEEEIKRLDELIRPVAYYVASESRKKFHRPNCKWAVWIPAHRERHFDHREEAIAAGLKPCCTCCA